MTLDVRKHLDPQMAEALAKSEALAAEFGPPVARDDVASRRAAYAHERAFWNALPVDLAATEDLVVEAAGLITPLRLYRPHDALPRAALVYLHGGGFILGSLETHDPIMRLFAKHAGVTVIGVDYALAPETRFPRQIEQIAATIEQLPARFALAAARIALGGDSAGAHLALATTIDRRNRGGALPAALLLLRQLRPARRRLVPGLRRGLGSPHRNGARVLPAMLPAWAGRCRRPTLRSARGGSRRNAALLRRSVCPRSATGR